MPFGLMDYPWSPWFLAAIVGVVLAVFIPKLAPEGSRFAGKLVFVIICMAALCGFMGLVRWFELQ